MPPSVEFISVTKTFASGRTGRNIYTRLFKPPPAAAKRTIFQDLDLRIDGGEAVALVGPNGSGKTTLLKLIAGLAFLDRGSIRIGGQAHDEFDRGRVGLILGADMIYSGLTGYQNLEYSAHLYRCDDPSELIHRAIEQWGIQDYVDSPVGSYSAGMRARLALARGTLHSPSLVLLDEPTVFLDSDGATRLRRYLGESGKTVIVTTHQPDALVVDRFIEMNQLQSGHA